MDWNILADKTLKGETLTRDEAQAVLSSPDDVLLSVISSAFRVRKEYFGKRVKLNFLLNAKSGLCPEDCFYCSQSKLSQANIDKYPFLSEGEILAAAGKAVEVKAKRFCMVNSGRGPTNREVEQITAAVKRIKEYYPQLELCVCLGLLQPDQARELKSSGVDAYNHNLNTSENHYGEICSTHSYADRLRTVQTAKDCGLSPCTGCLFGLGESDKDIIDLAYTLREVRVDSIPINFLMPIPGTPLAQKNELTPQKCLKILSLFRFLNPKSELRIAGGREIHLRWLQPLGLYVANSIFIGHYLTTQGQKPEDDLAMISDLGFEIEGHESGNGNPTQTTADFVPAEFSVKIK